MMSDPPTPQVAAEASEETVTTDPASAPWRLPAGAFGDAFSLRRISGVYVLIVLIVVFGIWTPHLFLNIGTLKQVLNTNAIIALAALALLAPLATGVFDISVPYTMSLSGVLVSYSLVNSHIALWPAIVIAMAACLLIGAVNAIVVVWARVDGLIGTLATGFLIQAALTWRTGGQTVTGDALSGGFRTIAQNSVGGFTLPVIYVGVLALALWFALSHTATGRRMYATGFNQDAAKLASIRVRRIRVGALMTSSLLAGLAGIVLASSIGSGDPTTGTTYLLPSIAAVFLGATQFHPGRFNALGTLLAVVLLGVGTTGLGLAGQAEWVQNAFIGVVLLLALMLQSFQGNMGRVRRLALGKSA